MISGRNTTRGVYADAVEGKKEQGDARAWLVRRGRIAIDFYGGAVISAVLNIAAAALVLPNAGLALFFLGVGVAARQTMGSLMKAFVHMLLELPSFAASLLLVVLAAIAIVVAVVVATIRMPILLPIIVLVVGIVSSLYVFWALGLREGAGNQLTWLAAVGLVLAGIQLWRNLQSDA